MQAPQSQLTPDCASDLTAEKCRGVSVDQLGAQFQSNLGKAITREFPPRTVGGRRKVLLRSDLGVSVHWPKVRAKRYSRDLNQSVGFAERSATKILGEAMPGSTRTQLIRSPRRLPGSSSL